MCSNSDKYYPVCHYKALPPQTLEEFIRVYITDCEQYNRHISFSGWDITNVQPRIGCIKDTLPTMWTNNDWVSFANKRLEYEGSTCRLISDMTNHIRGFTFIDGDLIDIEDGDALLL
jgi:glutamate dehydrogenase/leucine dehydrogenase